MRNLFDKNISLKINISKNSNNINVKLMNFFYFKRGLKKGAIMIRICRKLSKMG